MAKPITAGQKKQVVNLITATGEEVLGQALPELDREGAQKLIANGGVLKDRLRGVIATAMRELSQPRYANEEVSSRYVYPEGYAGFKPITEQTNRLRQLFPGIGYADESVALQPLPSIMEGYAAIPRWQDVAPTYGGAVEKVIALLKAQRPLINYREGHLGEKNIRQSPQSAEAWKKLAERQEGCDILIVPVQFGLRHRGKSVRRAHEMFAGSEFGLGAFATGILLLAHPERLVAYEDLWIDCAGDEYAPDAGGAFVCAPYWRFSDGYLYFGTCFLGFPLARCGSASGCLPG